MYSSHQSTRTVLANCVQYIVRHMKIIQEWSYREILSVTLTETNAFSILDPFYICLKTGHPLIIWTSSQFRCRFVKTLC